MLVSGYVSPSVSSTWNGCVEHSPYRSNAEDLLCYTTIRTSTIVLIRGVEVLNRMRDATLEALESVQSAENGF